MLARELLAKDGVIFISIDSNESHNLKLMCDEVFGGDNFVAEIACVNKPSGRSDDKYIATAHESIFIYRRSEALEFGGFVPEEQIVARYRAAPKTVFRCAVARSVGRVVVDIDRRAVVFLPSFLA